MAVIKRFPNKQDLNVDSSISYKSEFSQYNTMEQIYEKAASLNIDIIPFDVFSFLKKHNDIIVKLEDMEMDVSGCIQKKDDKFIIKINQYHNPQRQRFTMAHEFAHILLHNSKLLNNAKPITETILFRDKSIDPIEREANEFAAKLLMPESEFVKSIRNGYNTVEKLAEKFNVSPAAARYRAYKLGYIKEY